MKNWVMSANTQVYDHEKAFRDQGYINWSQTRNFSVGDYIFIYCSKPIS